MKTDTLWFRLALTAAALWLAFWGYQSISQYNDAKAAELSYRNDPSRYEACDTARLDEASIGRDWKYRDPTYEERQACRRMADEGQRKFEAEQPLWYKLIDERNALSSFFYRGLLPAGFLLLIVAGWGWITLGFGRYVSWLKTGKAIQGGD